LISTRNIRTGILGCHSQLSLLRCCANRNSCSIFRPDSQTTVPYTHTLIPRRPRYNGCQGLRPTSASDCLFCARLGSLPILIDTTSRQSFQNILDRPDFTRMDWAAFQACLDDRVSGNPVVNDEGAIDKCAEELTSVIQEATATSAHKRRPCGNPRSPLPASIQNEMCLKNRLRSH
jgi:hypothetical protein